MREFESLNRPVEAAKLKVPIAEAFALVNVAKVHRRLRRGTRGGLDHAWDPSVVIAQRPIDRALAPTHVMGVARFERFFRAAAGLDVDKEDLKRYSDFVNHKVYDLLIRGEATAKANDRDLIEPIDLPITKGLQENIHLFKELDENIELKPILDHLTARPPLDLEYSEETVSQLPAIAGGLSVALARAFKIIDPDIKNPQTKHWQRSFQIFDLLV